MFVRCRTGDLSQFRCKFKTKLLLSIQDYIVDQPDIAKTRRSQDQCLFISNLFNRLHRITVDDSDIIEIGDRLARDTLSDNLGKIRSISFTLLESQFRLTKSLDENYGLFALFI